MSPDDLTTIKADLNARIPGVVWTVTLRDDGAVQCLCEWPLQHKPPLRLATALQPPGFPVPLSFYADHAMAALRAYWTEAAVKAPTHQCTICGALWRHLADGSWNLVPGHPAGACCDNAPMGAQMRSLTQH